MVERLTWKYRLTVHLIAFGWCTIMAFFYAILYYESMSIRGEETSILRELVPALLGWWPCVIMIAIVLWMNQLFPFVKGRVTSAVIAHGIACILISIAYQVYNRYLYEELYGHREILFMSAGTLLIRCMYYWLILLFFLGIDYYRRYRERVVRTSRLEAQLARAQLQVLKMQLHPHFLFNTLHAISALMHRDLEAAERMITRLSELLRLSLENLGSQEVTLRKELDFLKVYLDIEQIRFGDRLMVERRVEPEALPALVPNLILQPIVENAINHGISKIASQGRITLQAGKLDHTLCIEVCDNGPGLPEGEATPRSKVGLANTMARLEQLYGNRGEIEFVTPEVGGLTVRMRIPFHTDPEMGTLLAEKENADDQDPDS
ncbi:MAG: sensor histidine kinase [Planctomycetota bacterium]